MRGLVALAALACALLGALPASAFGAGTISGKVVAVEGEAPIAGAEVAGFWVGEGTPSGTPFAFAATNGSGVYTLEGREGHSLAEGEWVIRFAAESQGYVPQYYNGKSEGEEADRVPVGSSPVENVDAKLVLGGRIEGEVTRADTNAPLADLEVCVSRAGGAGAVQPCVRTDAEGHYAVIGLPSGEYTVEFWGEEMTPAFFHEYYDDKSTLAEAKTVPVTAPAVVTGINAALTPVNPPAPSSAPTFSSPPPPLTFTPPPPVRPHRLHCRKGFRKRKVKGRVRCVKIHKKRHRHHAAR